MKCLRLNILFIMLILMAGCFKLPIGEEGETLELSEEGVTVTDTEGEETTVKMDEKDGTLSISILC